LKFCQAWGKGRKPYPRNRVTKGLQPRLDIFPTADFLVDFWFTNMVTSLVTVRQDTARSRLSLRGLSPESIRNSNRYTAIKNPNNPSTFSNFEFSNRYKTHFLSIRFPFLPTVLATVLLTTTRRRCYLPPARAIQYPVIHTGDSNPA